MTTFSDRLYQMGGVPVGVDLVSNKIFSTKTKGRAWFVDTVHGNNKGGKSPDKAFTTMDAAFDVVGNGDIIYFVGKITEQLVTPVQIFDVTVVGCGNRPRHADATPSGGNYAAAQWGPPASGGTAAQATVRVIQQGWRFVNILFTAIDTNAAMIEVVRNADSGDSERDGSHCEIIGCRFAGDGIGVRITATSFTENPFNVYIGYNKFNSCTYGILASAAQPNSCTVEHNTFQGCTNAITAKFQASQIGPRNVVMGFTAASSSGGIDVRSGGGNNLICMNVLGGTYSNAGGYNGESGDQWLGNAASTAGATTADPA